MEPAPLPATSSLFEPGRNCWRVEEASYATLLVDCAHYYRALHESIRQARHSLFILGWDIDSRIELLRGKEAKESPYPHRLFELIRWKAEQNPELQIYLNRWDFSWFMAADREGFAKLRWYAGAPPNVHYCLDGAVPVGACHHQKIITVDDEVAYCGGMDIALARWDYREHLPKQRNRIDPRGTYHPGTHFKFGPHHDIQMVVAGPVAQRLAELARDRWFFAAGYQPVAMRKTHTQFLPSAWPHAYPPDFRDAPTAIALTLPPLRNCPPVRQVEQLYLDMISRAERFIYMENQFFTHQAIAQALSRRLKEKPGLRALLVSCYDPEGIMERKAMWHGRVRFRDIVESGIGRDQFALAYPISRIGDIEKPVRIHSKVMVVDDIYLRVGSSNINNRSMTLDSECDLVIEGRDEATRRKIAALRTDLIREHTGREADDIEHLIRTGASVEKFLNYISHSRQHLQRINDETYRHEPMARLATALADPDKPFFSVGAIMPQADSAVRRGAPLRLLLGILVAVVAFSLVWHATPLAEYASPQVAGAILQRIQQTPWMMPAAIAFFIVGSLVFLPRLVMTGATVIAFPPLEAFAIIMIGSLLSAALDFFLGRWLGQRSLRALVGLTAEKVRYYTHRGGILGVALLRMIPLAPYLVVNLAFGMTHVPARIFLIGTTLGLAPGAFTACLLGDALVNLWEHPTLPHVLYAAGGLLAWIGVVAGSHWVFQRWQRAKRIGNA